MKGLNFYDFIFFCLPTRGQCFPVGGSSTERRSAKHSLYGRDVPLNTCIDNLDVENIGIIIIISQRATVTEYPEALLPRARN